MNIVTNSQMAEIDRRAREEFGMAELSLMENAGQSAYRVLLEFAELGGSSGDDRPQRYDGKVLLFVVGSGNNGGDALVMARQAQIDGRHIVYVVTATAELKGPAALHAETCRALGVPFISFPDQRAEAESAFAAADWIIDGLAGTGIQGALRGSYADMVAAMNKAPGRVAAIDAPSGIGDGFQPDNLSGYADLTISVDLPKLALYLPEARRRVGTIRLCSAGFPRKLTHDPDLPGRLLRASDLERLVPRFDDAAYKTKRGVVAVYAGARGTTGAALLCSHAAAKSGAGMVRLFVDEEIYEPIASQCRAVMVVSQDKPTAISAKGYNALLVGPGWGRGGDRFQLLRQLLETGLPGVLDADGLNVLADAMADGEPPLDFGSRWVLTPHPGECARLLQSSTEELMARPIESTLAVAEKVNGFCVLKSHVTYAASPQGRYWILDGMNRALATGGSGDVLSGVVAGLLAQGARMEEGIQAGLLAHSRAGAVLAEQAGWFLAEELVDTVGAVLATAAGLRTPSEEMRVDRS